MYTGFTPSARLSVRPSVPHPVSVLWHLQFWLDPLHIYTSYQATSEGVSRVKFLAKFKNLYFWQFFKICNFDFVLFWLGIWCESLVWVIMGQRGVSQNAGVLVLMTDGCDISSEIFLRWTSLDLSDDKSALVQVMTWCRQATSHYLNQCWPRSLPPYGVTRPQWVKVVATFNYVGRSYNLLIATTGFIWIISSFWIWDHVLYVEHIWQHLVFISTFTRFKLDINFNV